MTYKLADGSLSTDYKVGDKFVVGKEREFSKGSIVEFICDSVSELPRLKLVEGGCNYEDGEAYEYWKNLKPYKTTPKSLLKDGCWVTYRNGEKLLVLGDELFRHAKVGFRAATHLRFFNDDLLCREDEYMDIMTIEYMDEIIWQREEETAEQKEIKRLREVIEDAKAKLKEIEG